MEGVTRVAMGFRPSISSWTARAALAHPLWWAAALVLLLNDHYLKGSGVLAGWVTGKLSDFAGLLMAPVVLAAVVAPRSRGAFWLAHVAVGVAFALLKLSTACAAVWCALGGALGLTWRVVSDPTDLVALPVLLISVQLFGRCQAEAMAQAWRRVLATAGGCVGMVGIVATSRPPARAPIITPRSVLIAVDDELQALDRTTGKLQRRLDCRLDWSDRHYLADGLLFTGVSAGVQACDLARGVVAWERDVAGGVEIAHADARRVIVRSRTDVWALSPRSGAPLWHVAVPNLRAVAAQESLLIQRIDGDFKFVSLTDGRSLTVTSELPPGVTDALLGSRKQVFRFPGPASTASQPELVFSILGGDSGKGRLVAFAGPEQRPLWSIPWRPWSESAVVDDTLLVTQREYRSKLLVTGREPRDGHVLWHTVLDD